jgi:hypothetical protein
MSLARPMPLPLSIRLRPTYRPSKGASSLRPDPAGVVEGTPATLPASPDPVSGPAFVVLECLNRFNEARLCPPGKCAWFDNGFPVCEPRRP